MQQKCFQTLIFALKIKADNEWNKYKTVSKDNKNFMNNRVLFFRFRYWYLSNTPGDFSIKKKHLYLLVLEY